MEELESRGVLLDALKEESGKDLDDFDLILHIAYDKKPLTKKERVEHVKKKGYLYKYSGLCQEVLSALLEKYMGGDSTAFPVGQALGLAFEGGARVLGQEQDLGALQVGKLADIALVRQDAVHVWPRYDPAANLVYSSRASDVDTVLCNGKVLMRWRELRTIDKARVMREVAERLGRLNQRVPGSRIATYPV